MQTSFHLAFKNYWPPFSQISLTCVNHPAAIIGVIHCQQTVQVQIICKVVPTKAAIFALIRQNIVQFGIHISKIGKLSPKKPINPHWLFQTFVTHNFRRLFYFWGSGHFREVSNNQSSVSTVVSGSSSGSQNQHPIIPATSPLSQYTTNGDVQKLRTTTPPHNLSNSQNQQRGNLTV